jgi:hypothetical protein
MTIEEKIFELHRKAYNLAFAYYLRKGFVPLPLPEIINATTSLEMFLKYNPDEPRDWHGRWTTGGDDASDDNTDGSDAGSNTPTDKPTTSGGAQNPQLIPASATGGNSSKPDSFDPTNQNPPIPDYKKDSVNQADWNAFNQQLTQMQQSGEISPTEAYAYREIFAAEGGMSQDPAGSAVAGITQSDLSDFLDRVQEASNDPTDPDHAWAQEMSSQFDGVQKTTDLNAADVADVYNYMFDTQYLSGPGGSDALNKVGDPYAAAALADTMFRNGQPGGSLIVQNAINDVYQQTGNAPIPVDSNLGSGTLNAYSNLAQNPDTSNQLLDDLAGERARYLSANGSMDAGDFSRIQHFRFVRERNDSI